MKKGKHHRLYLPEMRNNCEAVSEPEADDGVKGIFPCPCCGNLTFPVPKEEAMYICPVCFWENDVFLSSDDEPSDENHGMTLNEARRNVRLIGACSREMLKYVRKPKADEIPK